MENTSFISTLYCGLLSISFYFVFSSFFLGVFVLAHWVRNMLTHSKQNKANCGA